MTPGETKMLRGVDHPLRVAVKLIGTAGRIGRGSHSVFGGQRCFFRGGIDRWTDQPSEVGARVVSSG